MGFDLFTPKAPPLFGLDVMIAGTHRSTAGLLQSLKDGNAPGPKG